jgi:hypothetical protein
MQLLFSALPYPSSVASAHRTARGTQPLRIIVSKISDDGHGFGAEVVSQETTSSHRHHFPCFDPNLIHGFKGKTK